MTERWREVPGWSLYEVSDSGRVRRIDHRGNGPLVMRQFKNDWGYRIVTLSDGRGGNRKLRVHRLVALAFGVIAEGDQVDHINRDKTDNALSNLRRSDSSRNQANSLPPLGRSGFKGVIVNSGRGKEFRARITVNGRQVHLGMFDCAEEAAVAYDAAALSLFGEHSYTNEDAGILRRVRS